MSRLIDLTGQKFGRLTVVKRAKDKIRKNGKHEIMWECLCDCGNIEIVSRGSLRSSKVRSCGCLRKENTQKMKTKHGLRNTRLYKTWSNIKSRCYNPNKDTFNYYGERNIIMCDEWKENFLSFYNWSIEHGYKEELTIDRINPNGNYEPNNCRWITMKKQQNNKLNNHYIIYKGEKHTLMEWSEILNINYKALHKRLAYLNWSIERAFTTPIKKGTK